MSRPRLIAKLRPQPWFSAVTDWLDEQGVAWSLHGPTGCGHPSLHLTLPDGTEIRQGIPHTPRQAFAQVQQVARVRRTLREGGNPRVASIDRKSAWTPERIACLTHGVNPLAESHRGTGTVAAR